MDRRDSPRTRAPFEVLVSAGAEEAAGALVDISHSGARVEDCSLQPPVGSRTRLYLYLPGVPAFDLEGVVSRHTETGFALRYELHDADLGGLVDAVIERLAPAAAS